MASWNKLPPELRLIILQCVGGKNPNTARHKPWGDAAQQAVFWTRGGTAEHRYVWAPYAAVSREWQVFFERRTFAALALFSDDVETFCAAVARCPDRLAYISRLRLTIDLPAYSCGESVTDENSATMAYHDVLFTRCLWRLLRALAAWKEPGPADGSLWIRDDGMFRAGTFNSAVGIQLELGVRSVSDAQHAFLDYRLQYPYGPISHSKSLYWFIRNIRGGRSLDMDSNVHSWARSQRGKRTPPAACRRVLGGRLLALAVDGLGDGQPTTAADTGMDSTTNMTTRGARHQMRRDPPVAAVVRKLVLGRRFYRSVHPVTLANLLRMCLPRVQSAHLEPWRPVTAASLNVLERGYGALLEDLPPTLDRLSVVLESNCFLNDSGYYADPASAAAALRRPSPRLGRQVAVASRRLALLNVAFLAEADNVLAAVARMPATATWPRLRTIILTSSTLTQDSTPTAIMSLLAAAATAAARMPHLRQLELWYARDMHACVFTVDGAHLRLRATWSGAMAALTKDVLDAWRAVVATWTQRPLQVTTDLWDVLPNKGRNLDARMMVLNGDTLAREVLFEQSRQDMVMERGRLWHYM